MVVVELGFSIAFGQTVIWHPVGLVRASVRETTKAREREREFIPVLFLKDDERETQLTLLRNFFSGDKAQIEEMGR